MIDLEDLGYEDINKELAARFHLQNREFRAAMLEYTSALWEIETKLKVLNAEFSLHHDRNPIESIKTRLKAPESIINKMKRRGLAMDIASMRQNILDIAGVRIICSFEEDVYYLRDCLANQHDIQIMIEKDYIINPKPNGYRSLHLTIKIPVFFAEALKMVPVEIQFRTIAMDFWASLEHTIRYKKEVAADEMIAGELLACARSSHEMDRKMSYLMKLMEEKRRKLENSKAEDQPVPDPAPTWADQEPEPEEDYTEDYGEDDAEDLADTFFDDLPDE